MASIIILYMFYVNIFLYCPVCTVHFLPKNQYCQCGVPIVKNTVVADGVTQIVKKKV